MLPHKTGILRVYKPSISLGRKKFKHNVRRTVLSTPRRVQKKEIAYHQLTAHNSIAKKIYKGK